MDLFNHVFMFQEFTETGMANWGQRQWGIFFIIPTPIRIRDIIECLPLTECVFRGRNLIYGSSLMTTMSGHHVRKRTAK